MELNWMVAKWEAIRVKNRCIHHRPLLNVQTNYGRATHKSYPNQFAALLFAAISLIKSFLCFCSITNFDCSINHLRVSFRSTPKHRRLDNIKRRDCPGECQCDTALQGHRKSRSCDQMAPRWQLENIHCQKFKWFVAWQRIHLFTTLLLWQIKFDCRHLLNSILFLIAVLEWEGESLELTRISRLDMGAYLCIASNGVPPSVSKRIKVSVDCKYYWCSMSAKSYPTPPTTLFE